MPTTTDHLQNHGFTEIDHDLKHPRIWKSMADSDQLRFIHVKALGPWTLTGKTTAHASPIKNPEQVLELPAGEYTLAFPPASPNLVLLVIDPDPGGGETK